jgi:hypothetical protein
MSRAFNLTEDELISRFLGRYVNGRLLDYGDREWEPKKLTLVVYEAPELRPDEIGLGRGWNNVIRAGADVTERMLDEARTKTLRHPALDRLKDRMIGRLAVGELALADAVGMADELMTGKWESQRLRLTQLAVWELLHEQEIELFVGGPKAADMASVEPERWEATLLDEQTWSPDSHAPVLAQARRGRPAD